MSAGLPASTVTPGSTAPDVSLATPAMLPDPVCAPAGRAWAATNTNAMPIACETNLRTMYHILLGRRVNKGPFPVRQVSMSARAQNVGLARLFYKAFRDKDFRENLPDPAGWRGHRAPYRCQLAVGDG